METGEEEDEGEMMEDEQHGSAGGWDDLAVSSSADRNVHQGTASEMEEQHGNTDWKHQGASGVLDEQQDVACGIDNQDGCQKTEETVAARRRLKKEPVST